MVTRRRFLTGFGAIGAAGAASMAGAHNVRAENWSLQTFSPDTCSCVVTEEWDTDADPATRINRLVRFERRGPEHAHILDDSLYPTIKEENRRKNLAQGQATLIAAVENDQVAWSFNAARTLIISFPELNVSASKKQQIQDWCDTNLGPEKVLVL